MHQTLNTKEMPTESDEPVRISPQQQLWSMTNERQQVVLGDIMRHMKKRYQEDLCYAMIAYMRFKIRRPFENPLLKLLFDVMVNIVDRHSHAAN